VDEGQRKCRVAECTNMLPAHTGPGAPKQFCPLHSPRGNRRRDVETLIRRGKLDEATDVAAATGLLRGHNPSRLSRARELAIAIRTCRGDVAAALVELGLEPAEADPTTRDLLAEAHRKFGDVINDRPGALTAIAQDFALQALARTNDPSMTGQQAGAAFASIAKGTETLNQGARKAYTNVFVVVPGLYIGGEPPAEHGRQPGGGANLPAAATETPGSGT